MPDKCQVPVCVNHLGLLYAAIKEGNLSLMDKVEHELTVEEKCVACSYVFKTHGTVKNALIAYLSDSGLSMESAASRGGRVFWVLRMFVLFVTLGVIGFLFQLIKHYVFGMQDLSFFSFGILELSVVILSSLVIFLVLDDLFFD